MRRHRGGRLPPPSVERTKAAAAVSPALPNKPPLGDAAQRWTWSAYRSQCFPDEQDMS